MSFVAAEDGWLYAGDAGERLNRRDVPPHMIPHPQMAVDMSEKALDEAGHPELKDLARKIIDEQSAEIELMEGYLEEIEAAEKG